MIFLYGAVASNVEIHFTKQLFVKVKHLCIRKFDIWKNEWGVPGDSEFVQIA